MEHDENNDRKVNRILVVDAPCGADVLPALAAGSLFSEGTHRAYTPEMAEEGDGVVDPAELMGDWSWRPQMQIKDPGYTFTKDELVEVNDALELGRAFGVSEARALRFASRTIAPRPWMVSAHVPSPGQPPRINSIR